MISERPAGGEAASLGFVHGQGRRVSVDQAPRVEICVGRDRISGGITMVAYLIQESGHVRAQALMVHRWQSPPQSVEECLQIAYRGLLAYFEESGILIP